MARSKKRLIVVGNGMVGHRLVEGLTAGASGDDFEITVFGEETRPAYDRVNLSKFFEGAEAAKLALASPDKYAAAGSGSFFGDAIVAIDRKARRIAARSGLELGYDKLVLATGSAPFVPPIEGRSAPGCFVYRTIDDLEAIAAAAESASVGAVIGGGLLGLEAANALRNLGLETHVVEIAPRLMAVQVDETGGALLRRRIEALGVAVRLGASAKRILTEEDGRVAGVQLADGGEIQSLAGSVFRWHPAPGRNCSGARADDRPPWRHPGR